MPRVWFSKLSMCLLDFGFVGAQFDSSMFIQDITNEYIVVVVYINDINITGSISCAINNLISKLHSVFALKDIGTLNYFLGLEVVFYNNVIHLNQQKYVKKLLDSCVLLDSKECDAPMSTCKSLSKFDENSLSIQDVSMHHSIVRRL